MPLFRPHRRVVKEKISHGLIERHTQRTSRGPLEKDTIYVRHTTTPEAKVLAGGLASVAVWSEYLKPKSKQVAFRFHQARYDRFRSRYTGQVQSIIANLDRAIETVNQLATDEDLFVRTGSLLLVQQSQETKGLLMEAPCFPALLTALEVQFLTSNSTATISSARILLESPELREARQKAMSLTDQRANVVCQRAIAPVPPVNVETHPKNALGALVMALVILLR